MTNKTIREYVTLVDEKGNPVGCEEKISVHEKGLLHSAFSIVLTNAWEKDVEAIPKSLVPSRILLQKRQIDKYHSGGLWSNACCGHPKPGENILDAAHRRLFEELGIAVALQPAGTTTYRLDVGRGLIEHEWNSIFIGQLSEKIPLFPNESEISHLKWVDYSWLKTDLVQNPKEYSAWLPWIVSA
jgi:isopentenyl-diphosphate delta-isomerase